ncbi:MAG: hypothetical protein JXA67_15275 [Micromonosporaceae bacterium]|nr:hypothetical protein [Micromonosporaceae bacterium]
MSLSEFEDRPIFVDDTFRRRRLVVAGGTAAGFTLALAALALVSGFTSAGERQPPAWPDQISPAPNSPSLASPSLASPSLASPGQQTAVATPGSPGPTAGHSQPTTSPSGSPTKRRGRDKW